MKNSYRDMYCGLVSESEVGNDIVLSGFVENIRDHGGVIFVDLRDSEGVVQLVSNDDSIFSSLTRESVINIKGVVRKRNLEDFNNNIKSGHVEVLVFSLEILSRALNNLPFDVKTSKDVSEDVRLKYRFLDMRNKKVGDMIKFRSSVLKFMRSKMDSLSFTEVQTPILTASSPEGARDFIVPSRKFPGKFYALPQAPQIFKELLMVGGIDRYYQVAPCFRDEDCRSDRTLEFYQLDMELAFATEEDVYKIGEDIFYSVFSEFSDKVVSSRPFRRISYSDSMLMYGNDKPDLRNPLVISDVTSVFSDTTFGPFKKSTIRAIKVEGISTYSNSWFNEIVDYAKSIGMPGIGYLTLVSDGFKGPIDKFLSDAERDDLISICNLSSGDVIFFIADKNVNTLCKYAGLIRTYLGKKLDLIDHNKFEFCIINDIPMFEMTDDGSYDFCHNPFSMPKGGIDALSVEDITSITAEQFDFVCNGYEVSSGAVRNHNIECLEKVFSMIGYDKSVVKERFSSLYNAFHYGAPPHAGMAPGIDRIIMLLKDESNLREVQAFPTSVSGQDFLMGSPSSISEKQLREVHIKLR